MSKRLYQQIETLWDYLQLHQQPNVADLILVLGSNDVRVAEHAAKLYHQGLAPYVLFSGGFGRFTQGVFNHNEAETFAAIAKDAGVPEHAILLETQSTNSGENLHFSHQLLVQQARPAKRILLVQKTLYGTSRLCDIYATVARIGRKCAGYLTRRQFF